MSLEEEAKESELERLSPSREGRSFDVEDLEEEEELEEEDMVRGCAELEKGEGKEEGGFDGRFLFGCCLVVGREGETSGRFHSGS